MIANPVPLMFWRRELLWRTEDVYGSFEVSLFGGEGVRSVYRPIGMNDLRIAQRVSGNPGAKAFLFWSRMPVAELKGDTIVLRDQRFLGLTGGRFAVELNP